MVIEPDGVRYVLENDRTAWVVDARPREQFETGAVAGARNVPPGEVPRAKNDGRLPMTDHNTRVIVVGENGPGARAVAEELARNAFHNVTFFDGSYEAFRHAASGSDE